MTEPNINITMTQLEELMVKTVNETLTKIGVDHTNPLEMQRDFDHLRSWRKSVDKTKTISFTTAIGILTSGLLGALWIGLKDYIHK